MTFRFFSDTNLDGFVQSISLFGQEVDVNLATREVVVEYANDTMLDLVDSWGGVVL
jgi:hypothetical protein